jgi:hypothetical protein
MKKSDLDLLLKIENIQAQELKKELQEFRSIQEEITQKNNQMNDAFIRSTPDIDRLSYSRYVSIQNQYFKNQLSDLENNIDTLQDKIRDTVLQEKKYEILLQQIEEKRKQTLQKYEENKSDDFNMFQYTKSLDTHHE